MDENKCDAEYRVDDLEIFVRELSSKFVVIADSLKSEISELRRQARDNAEEIEDVAEELDNLVDRVDNNTDSLHNLKVSLQRHVGTLCNQNKPGIAGQAIRQMSEDSIKYKAKCDLAASQLLLLMTEIPSSHLCERLSRIVGVLK